MARQTHDHGNPLPPAGEGQFDRRVILVLVAGAIFFLIVFGILLMTVLSPESTRGPQEPTQEPRSGETR